MSLGRYHSAVLVRRRKPRPFYAHLEETPFRQLAVCRSHAHRYAPRRINAGDVRATHHDLTTLPKVLRPPVRLYIFIIFDERTTPPLVFPDKR